jgi:hypothetical protein
MYLHLCKDYPEIIFRQPKFRHDCFNCLYLGLYLDRTIDSKTATLVDLYTCPGEWPVLVARWSDLPDDYVSGLLHAALYLPKCGLSEALRRVTAYDLLELPGLEIIQRRH